MNKYPCYRVAAAHAAPIFLDTNGSIAKACDIIAEAARHGARLVAFPEAFIPGFPVWAALQAPTSGHAAFKLLAAQAIRIDGPEIAAMAETARRHEIVVSMGFSEGTSASVGCVWNANILIDATGAIVNHRRKLVPTFFEKLVWANGDGAGLSAVETPLGRIGVLICGENTNPLARFTLMADGEQVHISTYPPVWPTRPPGDRSNYDLTEAIRIRAAAHAFEAKAFNIVVSAPVDGTLLAALRRLGIDGERLLEGVPRGASMVLGPNGGRIGPAVEHDRDEILYAEIDLADCIEPKQFHDVVGYYNRFDVFRLHVNRSANRPIYFDDEADRCRDTPATEPEDKSGAAHLRAAAVEAG